MKSKTKQEKIEINPLTEVVVQRAWFVGLLQNADRVEKNKNKISLDPLIEISGLLGYISSAKYILLD